MGNFMIREWLKGRTAGTKLGSFEVFEIPKCVEITGPGSGIICVINGRKMGAKSIRNLLESSEIYRKSIGNLSEIHRKSIGNL